MRWRLLLWTRLTVLLHKDRSLLVLRSLHYRQKMMYLCLKMQLLCSWWKLALQTGWDRLSTETCLMGLLLWLLYTRRVRLCPRWNWINWRMVSVMLSTKLELNLSHNHLFWTYIFASNLRHQLPKFCSKYFHQRCLRTLYSRSCFDSNFSAKHKYRST